MPSDETRRVLRTFGVAVTTYEDAVEAGAPADEIDKAEAEFRACLSELTSFDDFLVLAAFEAYSCLRIGAEVQYSLDIELKRPQK